MADPGARLLASGRSRGHGWRRPVDERPRHLHERVCASTTRVLTRFSLNLHPSQLRDAWLRPLQPLPDVETQGTSIIDLQSVMKSW